MCRNGSLSQAHRDPIEVNIQDLIFKQVAIKGFWISKWYQKNNYIFDERLNMLREILQLYFEKKLTLPKHSLISINDDLEGAFSHSKGIKQVFLFFENPIYGGEGWKPIFAFIRRFFYSFIIWPIIVVPSFVFLV